MKDVEVADAVIPLGRKRHLADLYASPNELLITPTVSIIRLDGARATRGLYVKTAFGPNARGTKANRHDQFFSHCDAFRLRRNLRIRPLLRGDAAVLGVGLVFLR